jgi:hypothetical protein
MKSVHIVCEGGLGNQIVKCVVCGKVMPKDDDGNMTAGYYKGWFGQEITCDDCMWADPRYIAQYGDMRKLQNRGEDK